MFRNFSAALGFLTRIPVGKMAGLPGEGQIFYPVVGLILGAIIALLSSFFSILSSPILVAVLVVIAELLLTGGLHYDGLMDTADGFFSGRGREDILKIMKDSRVGGQGVIWGTVNILLRFICFYLLISQKRWLVFPAVLAVSRWISVLILFVFPTAQSGLGDDSKKRGGKASLIGSTILTFLILFFLKEVNYFLMWAFVSLFALLIGWRIMRQLGGITGDVVGAEIEISENLGLIFLLFIF